MPPTTLSASLARVCRPVAPQPTDGALVAAFISNRDEAAFAELVRRHGPMVLAVCQRITGHCQDAEDAFQATFLVLARRAADVRPAEQVGNWLYGVAVRTARAARVAAARRRAREAPTHPFPEVGRSDPDLFAVDVRAVLDEELVRLPDKYRALLVACDLGGEPQAVVARQLGLPIGTVYSRLARARKALAERLRGRGLELGAGLAGFGAIMVPDKLLARTVTITMAGGVIPPAVAAITKRVLQLMLVHNLRIVPICLSLVALAVICSLGVPPAPSAPPEPVPPPHAAPNPSLPKKAGGDVLVVADNETFRLLTPDGKITATIARPKSNFPQTEARLSSDGSRIAYVAEDRRAWAGTRPPEAFHVMVHSPGKFSPDTTFKVTGYDLSICWTADGKSVLASRQTEATDKVESLRLELATGKVEPFDTPPDTRVLDAGLDGKTFLIETLINENKCSLGVMTVGQPAVRNLVIRPHPDVSAARLSPDGKTILFLDADPSRKDAYRWKMSHRPYRVDVATGVKTPISNFPEKCQATGVTWAPDGKRIAYICYQLNDKMLKKDPKQRLELTKADLPTEWNAFVIVADPDGKNPRTIVSEERASSSIDWR